MTGIRNFCTECGAPLGPDMRFCGQCGSAAGGTERAMRDAVVAEPANASSGGEGVIGIVPFAEQGLISVTHYTLIVTSKRLIFCIWKADTDEAMSDAEDEAMQESCNISDTIDEIAHFQAKDWSGGPWERYRTIPLDDIIVSAPGSLVISIESIAGAEIVCEQKTSTLDKLYIEENDRLHTFDLIFSQGPFLGRILAPLLGDRLSVTDQLHRRGKLDRLLSGEEYS